MTPHVNSENKMAENTASEMFTFKKTDQNTYRVSLNDVIIGSVIKREAWTVRGNHTYWSARKNGKFVGRECETRKEAAEYLK